jgi:phage-related minor tail protein
MSFVDPSSTSDIPDLSGTVDKTNISTKALGVSANQFAKAMSKAFGNAVAGGKQFDDVLKSLALRLSNLALKQAFKPLAKDLAGGLGSLFGGIGGASPSAPAGLTPFANGGVIGAPSYFPLASGGIGLAGEAGPEAIVPLSRGSDGRLGVSMAGGAPPNISVQIVAPDPASFRRSEAYLTGQIARAVARGQRNL